jgi:hypothetical protein
MSAFPSTPLPGSVKITAWTPTLVSTAQSLKQQVRSRGGQRWKIDFTWDKRTRAQVAPIMAFIAALRGQYNTCTVIVPGHDTPQGSWAGGAPLVDLGSQTGRTLNIKGLTAGQTGIAKAGDFIVIAGDTKVYMVTADANSDGSGKAALSIEPALMLSPANNAAITYTAVPFTVALAADMQEFPIEAPVLYSFGLSFVERC